MTMRGVIYFLLAFTTVVLLGLLSGCASGPHDRIAKGYAFVQYCGMERCDGKANR